MDVTIIGTGKMARGLSTRLLIGGHRVSLVGHTPGKAESLATALKSVGDGEVEAAKHEKIDGDVVFLAVPYMAAQSAVQSYHDQLAGKTLVDVTDPINLQNMEPATPGNFSGAEGLAKLLPANTPVVKAFNTVFSRTLPEAQKDGLPLDVFIAADDPQAKAKVIQLVESGGMHPIDAGPLARARQLEALGLLHVALQLQINGGYATAKIILC